MPSHPAHTTLLHTLVQGEPGGAPQAAESDAAFLKWIAVTALPSLTSIALPMRAVYAEPRIGASSSTRRRVSSITAAAHTARRWWSQSTNTPRPSCQAR